MRAERAPRAWLGAGLLLVLAACAGPVRAPAPQAVACAPDDPRVLLGRAGFGTACSVELSPGESAVVRVPSGHELLARADRALRPGDLSIGVSNGTGIVAYPGIRLAGATAILPARPEPALAQVSRPGAAATPLRLTFRRSHEPDVTTRYGREIGLSGPAIAVRQRTEGDEERFTLLRPRAPVRFEVAGPAVLAVRARTLFDAGTEWSEEYRIEAALDGRPGTVLEFEATPDLTAAPVAAAGGAAAGTAETEYLVVPPGRHGVVLSAPRPVLVRVRTRPDLARTGRRDWSAMAPDPRSALAGCVDPDIFETRARQIATDNSRAGGGLVAAAWLSGLAERAPRDPDLPQAAARIRGAYTFFRDLVPERPGGLAQRVAYAAVPRLAPENPEEREDRLAPDALPTSELLGRLLRGVFVPVPGAGAPLSYALPPRAAASELRLIADQSGLGAAARLRVSFDGAAPVPVLVLPGRELDDAAYRASPAEIGLARLAAQTGVPAARVTTTGRFAEYQPPGPLLEAGTLAMPLPVGVERVTIWADDPGRPLRVALQYRAAATPGLSEAGYRATLAAVGQERAMALLADAIRAALDCPSWLADPGRCAFVARIGAAPAASREIYNDWIPILRLLRARERTLFGSLPPGLRTAPPPAGDGARPGPVRAAREAARAGRWQEALDLWAAVARGSGGARWARAQLGQAEALAALGEAYLAERLLKNLHLAAEEPAIRRSAHAALADLLEAENQFENLVGLHAAEFGRRPDPAVLGRLVAALERTGQAEMAAKLALLLPGTEALPVGLAERAGWAEPGPGGAGALWQSAEWLVRASAGAVSYRASERGTYGEFYRATPRQPLRLEVEGPARLRIAMRPLHAGGGDAPVDGWVRIDGAGAPIDVPVTDNRPTGGIELFGVAGEAGIAVTETVPVPAGRHVVTVAPDRITILVGVERMAGQGAGERRPVQELARLLRAYRSGSGDRPALLARAAALAHRHAGDPAVRDAWQDFDRLSSWERIRTFTRSAGSRSVPLSAPVESPALRARLALLPPFTPGERLVQTDGETAVAVVTPRPVEIEARLQLDTVPTEPSEPVSVSYRVDEMETRTLRLSPSDPRRTLPIAVPAGEHVIRFSVETRHANQFVRLRLRNPDGTEIDTDRRRSYEVATKEEPVVLNVDGPAWLRIDRHGAGGPEREHRYVEPGLRTVTIAPRAGRDEVLLRVFRLVPDLVREDVSAPRSPTPSGRVPDAVMPRADLAACRLL